MTTIIDDIAEKLKNIQLSPSQAQAFIPKMTKYMVHMPTPKQLAFLLLDTREALYGGAAGGGKSDAILMGALQYVDVPNYSAGIFRVTLRSLENPDGLIPRSHQWLGSTDATWRGQKKEWVFPSGATLGFGYLESITDAGNYQSAAYQYMGFDELTQFLEAVYLFMFSRRRRLKNMRHVPVRARGATNPGGIGHKWVYNRFIKYPSSQTGRVFIPAKLEDNPFLDQEEYDESLKETTALQYAQMRKGLWIESAETNYFRREYVKDNIIDALPQHIAEDPRTLWLRFWDFAATKQNETRKKRGLDPDYTSGVLLCFSPPSTVYVVDVQRGQFSPQEIEDLVYKTAISDGKSVPIWIEEEPGSSGISLIDHYKRNVLFGYSVQGFKSTAPKEKRAAPASTAWSRGGVYILNRPWTEEFLDELSLFPEGQHDDQVDSFSGAFWQLRNYGYKPVEATSDQMEEAVRKLLARDDDEEINLKRPTLASVVYANEMVSRHQSSRLFWRDRLRSNTSKRYF